MMVLIFCHRVAMNPNIQENLLGAFCGHIMVMVIESRCVDMKIDDKDHIKKILKCVIIPDICRGYHSVT